MDVRDGFVPFNKWGDKRPCPTCRPTLFASPPGKKLTGVMRIVGLVVTTGALLYECFTCKKEVELPWQKPVT